MTNPTTPPSTGNKQAVAALILGIMALLLSPIVIGAIVGIVAMVLGIRALKTPVKKGMAITGIVTGGISIPAAGIFALLISILLPALARAQDARKETLAAQNMRGLISGLAIYAAGSSDRLPPHLADLSPSMTPAMLHDPRTSENPRVTIPSSDRDQRVKNIDAESDFYFTLPAGRFSVTYSSEVILLYDKPRAGRKRVLAFADGHVDSFLPTDPKLRAAVERTNQERQRRRLGPLPLDLSTPPPEFGATTER